ncbi:MAG: CapA family protein, partial [Deltaproteobacteria bacterium]|nr:CapA family protein [Deltaproteobacteria bacterium]
MLILACALAAEPVPDNPPRELSAQDIQYNSALAALQRKDYDSARESLDGCLQWPRAHEGCLWERGWLYWLDRDWASVVSTWEKLDPAYPKLATNLALARDQLALQRLAAEMRAKAAATYQSTAPPGASLRLRGVGDMMIGSAFPEGALPPDGGKDTFTAVRSLLVDADLTFGNLEGPLCDDPAPSDKCRPDGAPGSCYAFRTPAAYGAFYKEAGFDVVSTANNHAIDFGESCRLE